MTQNDPLPSWNDGASKQAILDFVAGVTEEGGERFVPDQEVRFDVSPRNMNLGR